jgi:hypothetical protein
MLILSKDALLDEEVIEGGKHGALYLRFHVRQMTKRGASLENTRSMSRFRY